ncbi:MAG: hypothetical protein QM597_09720 [Aeromicrobium sp.]|uniref:hypothetical protein n=1 Tax=Aeromicrobium sp. TaxID=1871063 RepID=UPI0039E40F6C
MSVYECPGTGNWNHLFGNSLPPEVHRHLLVHQALYSGARWVGISGSPGMGRTTLLRQIVEELDETGVPYVAVWTPSQATDFARLLGLHTANGTVQARQWLSERAVESGAGAFTVVIDDLDLADVHAFCAMMAAVLDTLRGVRFIVTTFSPLELPSVGVAPTQDVLQLFNGTLRFTAEETRAAARGDAHRDATSLDENQIDQIHEDTGGAPLGVALAISRSRDGAWTEAARQAAQAVHDHIVVTYPVAVLRSGLPLVFRTLSLMPRFTDGHISVLFPDLPWNTVVSLMSSVHLRRPYASRMGEHVWKPGYWRAACEWSQVVSGTRAGLARRLGEMGDHGGEFGQHILARDFARADRLLGERFLSVFETMPPEIAREIGELPTAAFRPREENGYLWLGTVRVLLNENVPLWALAEIEGHLRVRSQKRPADAAMARAVLSAVLTRQGRLKEARVLAQSVFDDQARVGGDPQLIAGLTLLACGSLPWGGQPLSSVYSDPFLSRRRSQAQEVIDRIRHPGSLIEMPIADPLAGYRWLVYPPADAVADLKALAELDGQFFELEPDPEPRRGTVGGGRSGRVGADGGAGRDGCLRNVVARQSCRSGRNRETG